MSESRISHTVAMVTLMKPFCGLPENSRLLYSEELYYTGAVVVPVFQPEELRSQRAEFDDAVRNFPEFIDDFEGPRVMGGFAALGNPGSFHNAFVRRLRLRCQDSLVRLLWRDFIDKFYDGSMNFEQVIDRMLKRFPGQSATSESWHRDEAVQKENYQDDVIFGGWVNLDDTPQVFSCRLGTHRVKSEGRGFYVITDPAEKARLRRLRQQVEIPPGHALVFYENLLHEVVSKKQKTVPMYRVFLGWRVTRDTEPLLFPTRRDLEEALRKRATMKLKSGQHPAMYSPLHFMPKVIDRFHEFSSHVRPEFKEPRKKHGDLVKRHIQNLEPLPGKHYRDYSREEVDILVPHKIKKE